LKNDFGPLSIGQIGLFISKLSQVYEDALKNNLRILIHSKNDAIHKTNAILLIGCFEIIWLKRSAQEAFDIFKNEKILSYRDASDNECKYECKVSKYNEGY